MWHGSLVGAPGQWRDEQFSRGGSPDGVCAAAIGGRVAPGQHLARFVVEVVESLDLRAMTGDYRGSGSASYHPAVLLGILVYG